MLRWYLIHTKSCCESLAQINLSRQGYEVYCPRLLQTARRNGLLQERIRALFPRYLFVGLAGEQSLGPIRSTKGVSNVVCFGFNYAIVPSGVIFDLRQRADPQSGLHRLTCQATLTAGAPVRVVSGPFDGLQGVLQRETGAERVILLLNLLGRETPVGVPTRLVEPAVHL